jgi:hypothetical protein
MELRHRFPGTMLILLLSCLAIISRAQIINGTGLDGVTRELHVSRYPSLYTRDFDDCMGGNSLFNATKFDAAYYTDNLTVLFHLDGTTNVRDESVMCKASTAILFAQLY